MEDPETGHRTGHLKDEKAFREYGLVAPGPGTIAFMARDVNVRFRPGQDLSRPLEAFKELVPEPPASFKTVATELKIERAVTCRQAFQTDDRRARNRAFAGYEAIREETIADLVAAEIKHLESAGPVSDETRATTLATVRRNLSLGMWHAGHQPQRSLTQEEQAANPNRRPSTGSFAFQMLDDILDHFEQPQKLEPVAIIGVRHHEFQGQEWKGETRLVHVCTEPYGKHLGQAAYVVENGEAKKLGWVEWGKLVPETQYRMSLESTGKSVRATLVEAVGHQHGSAPAHDTAAWETVREKLVGSGVPERVVDGLHEQKRLWATELRETGADGESCTTALVLPTRHPRTGIQTGAQVFAVTVAAGQGEVREAGFAPAAETGSEAVVLHSPKLRLGVGEVKAPEKVYLTSRPDAYLRLAAERSQEAASFVLLPESGVSRSLSQWLRSEKADIVLALPDTEAGQRQEAALHRFLRTEAPELHVTTLSGRTPQLEEANRIPPPSAADWQAVRLQLVANASSREELRRIDTLHRDGRLYADAQGQAVRIMTDGEVFIRNFNTKAISRDVVSRETAVEAIYAAKAELKREPARSQGMEVVAGQGRKPVERARELPAVEQNQGQEIGGVEFGLG
ncbi:MAG: hypothetical protein K1Y36_21885 [Blastocatellia bacterium]|nr:hypothetical protein [Blastocatellia bacterium]